jgi:UDP-GlcNAc:undecaprenyl-phosphate/decaprenyl-phosphate GlcNAc-1-phosphate transferase
VVLFASMAMFVMGLVDDILLLRPATKLVAQIAAAAALVYFGFRLNWVESRLLDSVLTMVWVVGLTNAFNLLDNMDGLCAGIAFIVAAMLLAGFWTGVSRDNAMPEMTLLAALAGAALGFLVYNFPPASIFMGDSGSLLFGFSLAALTLGNEGVRASRSDVLSVIAGPAFVLLIPIFDTTLVTVARLLSGRSPAMGGRDHSSHRLVAIGLSERDAVLVLWLLASVGGGIGLLLRNFSPDWSLPVGVAFLLAMCVFAIYLARVRVYDDMPAGPIAAGVTPLPSSFMNRRRVVEVLVDVSLIGASYYFATGLVFSDPEGYLRNAEVFYQSLPVIVVTQLVALFGRGLYRGIWQPFMRPDLNKVLEGILGGTVIAQIFLVAYYSGFAVSWKVVLLQAFLVTTGIILSRLIGRMFPP